MKLEFHELKKLYGREQETQQLIDAYNSVTKSRSKTSSTKVVLVHGASGTGKTVLCRHIKKNTNCLFVEGKFDQVCKEPFSGLVQAFSAIADHFSTKGTMEVAEIQEAYRTAQTPTTPTPQPLSYHLSKLDDLPTVNLSDNSIDAGRSGRGRLQDGKGLTSQEDAARDELVDSISDTSPSCASQQLSYQLAKLNDMPSDSLDSSARAVGHHRLQRRGTSSVPPRRKGRGVSPLPPRRKGLTNQYTGESMDSIGGISSIVPQMKRFVQEDDVKTGVENLKSSLKSTRGRASFDKIKKSFCSFLRAVCSPEQPIVIFLRSLQWADRPSLHLFDSLVRDCKCEGLLILGSYRDDEVKSSFKEVLHRLHRSRNFLSIDVQNLKQRDLHRMIADVTFTSSDLRKSKALANVVYKKTNGNCFFAIQFLQMLNAEFLLYMNFSTTEFEYDIAKIKAETNVTDNVVDLIAGKLRTLPQSTREVLQVAAFLGSHFEIDVLAAIMETSVDAINRALYTAEYELLIDVSGNHCKWGHDKIQQSAYSSVPKGNERAQLHMKIGKVLRSLNETSDKEWTLFVAAEQLNRASQLMANESDILDLVRLNIQAAESVLMKSALYPASEYLTTAMRLLGNRYERWVNYYDLSLEVCTKLAEIEITLGRFPKGEDLILQILLSAKSDEDKIPALFAQIDCFRAQGNLTEAIDLGVSTLKKNLNETISRKPVKAQVSIDLNRTRRLLKGMTDEQILRLPIMTDKTRLAAMEMLGKVSYWAWSSGQRGLATLICLRIVKFTLDHGICEMSGYGLALYGAICGGSLESEEATRYGNLALTICEFFETLHETALPLYIHFAFVHHLRSPLQECLDPMLGAYRAGMDYGDIDTGHDCAATYVAIYTMVGLPLPAIQDDARKYVEQMKSYNRWLSISQLRVYWQFIMNFMGLSDDPLVLSGKAMDQDTLVDELAGTNQSTTLSMLWTLRMMLAYHFGNYDLAREMACLITKLGVDKGYFAASAQYGYLALTNLASAETARNPRKAKVYLREADRHIKVLSQMVKAKNVNASHMLQFCQAERASINKGDFDVVKGMYNKAIASASRSGILHDAAIANERAGQFMKRHGDAERAQDYVCRSAELYHSWGATAKTKQMQNRYVYLAGEESAELVSTGLLARQKFCAHTANKHKAVNISRYTGSA